MPTDPERRRVGGLERDHSLVAPLEGRVQAKGAVGA